MVKENIHLDQTMVFAVIQFLPCALFPVLIRHRTRDSTRSTLSALPLLAGRALDSRYSFGAMSSFGTWATLVTFDSITAITARWPRNPRDTTTTAGTWLLVWNKKIGFEILMRKSVRAHILKKLGENTRFVAYKILWIYHPLNFLSTG